jgi:hypothetical protein
MALGSALPLLTTVSSFADLPSEVSQGAAARCRSKTFRAGQIIFLEDDPA